MRRLSSFFAVMFSTATAMTGYTIHGSLFWAVVDFVFSPLAWCKWLVCHEVGGSVIRKTFSFLLK